jgi:hypothetical protein
MPAPRSRRSARASQRQEPAPVEDVDVDEPDSSDEYDAHSVGEAPEGAEPADSGRSSRRKAAGRSSRMSASERRNQARGSLKKSSRRTAISPEEAAKRRAARMLVVKLLLGVTVGIGAAVALWWFVFRVDEKELLARQKLSYATSLVLNIETSLKIQDPKGAETNRQEAIDALNIPELGFAKPNPNPEDPLLASVQLATQAAELNDRLEGPLKDAVAKVERDLKVAGNKRAVLSGFGRLSGETAFSDPELVTFERQVQDFLDNPVLPGAGAKEEYQSEYSNEIKEVKFEVMKIEQEKSRRESAITDIPVREARGKSAILVKQAKFQEALAAVDEMQRQYQNADFAGVRQYIRDAARLAWDATSASAAEHWTTWKSPGTTPALAKTAKEAARELMQGVIDNYGIPEYVDQAKAKLNEYR